jgi:hypothetical protein
VVEQQDPNGFTANIRHQFAFHGLLGYQPHGPSRAPLRRIATNHGNDPLFLAGVERHGRAWMLLIVQRPVQALVLIAPPDLAHCFGSQHDVRGHLGHRLTIVQLGEGESAKNHPDRLNTTSKQQGHFVPVALGQTDVESMVGSHDQV